MKRTRFFIFAALAVGHATTALATPHVSGLRSYGIKYPNSAEEGSQPVLTYAFAPRNFKELRGFKDLLPFVMASPNQNEAGSCLYMSLTGIAEWWLGKLYPWRSRKPDGSIDLSERHLMNLAGVEEDTNGISNWKTQSIKIYNNAGHGFLNRSYRFTKGWYKVSDNHDYSYVIARPGDEGAYYGTGYNWINELDHASPLTVRLPKFKPEVLFADPASNQWNVVVAPHDIVATVKQALQEKQAPVHVIYNHYGYWHAVNIVGFDDEQTTDGCPFVSGAVKFFGEKVAELEAAIVVEADPRVRAKLRKRLAKYMEYRDRLQAAYPAGKCQKKGVFYVRDSLYGDAEQPIYDYDVMQQGDEEPYAKPVIFREYDWLTYLANHVTLISVDRSNLD